MNFQLSLKNWIRYSLLTCLIFFFDQSKGQVIADFSASALQGCAPLVVQFSDLSVGSPSSWYWDLGNGNTSTAQNPGAIYFNPGSYTVKLVIAGASGTDSIEKVGYITIYEKPVVDFKASDSIGCSPLLVKFTDLSLPGSGTIARWQWDFGDGNSSTLQFPSNVYSGGTFNVTLIVINNQGCVASLTRNGYIKSFPKPVAGFTTQSTASCNPPALVKFSNTSTGGNITGYNWDFGDGTTSVAVNPTHSYTSSGVFNTVLTITNLAGCKDSISKIISIGAVSPDFIVPDSVCVKTRITITNTSAPSSVSALWYFGDGTTSNQINPVKTYNTPGNYNIKLVNNFGACRDSVTKKITVINKPTANFTYTVPPSGCSLPVTATFTSTSTGAVAYTWDFGDGGTSSIANPTHVYSVKGNYTVSLVVSNLFGCTDTMVKSNIVSIIEPEIKSISGIPFIGCVPFSNNFNPVITTPEPIVNYQWNFGDNVFSAAANPSHTYGATGTYDVTLIITTINGCKDTFKVVEAVKIGVRPLSNFTAVPLAGCASDSVQFTNTTIGFNDSWVWAFGDGSASADENPLHHYIDTGLFTVVFIAQNNGCNDTTIKKDYIYIKPPVANFSIKNYCDTPFLKRFINRSVAAVGILWDFGDGNTSTLRNPVHTYSLPGKYIVKLRVENAPCFDEFTDTVYVVNELPVLNIGNNPVCKNLPANISATGINIGNISQFLWTFGDTSVPFASSAAQVNHIYTASGTYNISLKITDRLGCKKTVSAATPISVIGPKAKLNYPSGGCVNSLISFIDQSQPSAGYPITSWTINYGDGNIFTTGTPVFAHTYPTKGTYFFNFSVKDVFGCVDSLSDSLIITKASIGFSVSDSLSCRQSLVGFINSSSGINLTYLWDFGDGSVSNLRNPSHIYTADGVYTISLKILDKYACVDSLTKDSIITISNAKASFAISDSVLVCPPAQVNFTNQSSYYSSLAWDFGDGSSSVTPNPTHFFLNGGVYNVKLTVFGFGSCIDSAIKKITVTGPRGTLSYSPLGACVPATINFVGFASNVTDAFIWDFGDGTTVASTSANISHTYLNVGKYVPRLLLRDTTINCSISYFGKDTIYVSNATAIFKIPPSLFCDSATIAFKDSSIITYDSAKTFSWNFGDGGTSGNRNPIHKFNSPGNYIVNMSLTTKYGCKDTALPRTIKVVKSPSISIVSDTSGCINQPVSFLVNLSQPDTSLTRYKWTFANGNTSISPNPPNQTYATPNTYLIKAIATNSSGCTDTAIQKLVIHPLPVVSAGVDSVICLGQSIRLSPSGALSYVWNSSPTLSCTNCTNPIAKPDSTIKYIVTGKSNVGCVSKDTVAVIVIQPLNLIVSLRDTICKGQSAILTANGADNYLWSPAAGLSGIDVANPTANPDTTTVYRVIGSDYKSCFSDTAYIPIIVYPFPVFNIIPNTLSIAAGSSVVINTNGSPDIISYRWSPSIGLNCNDCPMPLASPTKTTTYTATVTNSAGCITKSQVVINLLCGEGNIYLPNTFSPNGDGSNDVFFPRGKGITGLRNMLVFNRWGAVVFERTNLNINDESAGWDGTYKGQPASQDVYVYHLEVICASGEKFLYKGDVTLIR